MRQADEGDRMARDALCGSEIKERVRIPERSEVWDARKREGKKQTMLGVLTI